MTLWSASGVDVFGESFIYGKAQRFRKSAHSLQVVFPPVGDAHSLWVVFLSARLSCPLCALRWVIGEIG